MIDSGKQVHLRKLLSDTIPLLCRNGLGLFDADVSVEALIGVTINENELVLINFKELVTADGSTISHVWHKCDGAGNENETEAAHFNAQPELPEVENMSTTKKKRAEIPDNDENSRSGFRKNADENRYFDEIDADGVCYVDEMQWNNCAVVKTDETMSATTVIQRRRKTSKRREEDEKFGFSVERKSVEDTISNAIDYSFPSQNNNNPRLVIVKDEQRDEESDECTFIKVENENDGYETGTTSAAGASACADEDWTDFNNVVFQSSSSHPIKRIPRRKTWTENGLVDLRPTTHMKHSVNRLSMTKINPFHAQRRVQGRRSEQGQFWKTRVGRNQPPISNLPMLSAGAPELVASGDGGTALLPFPLGDHRPQLIPPTLSQFTPKKRCRVCYAKKVRKEVRYCCLVCRDHPGLCLSPCFSEYHEYHILPQLFHKGIISEYDGQSVQEHSNAINLHRDAPRLPYLSSAPGQQPDVNGPHQGNAPRAQPIHV